MRNQQDISFGVRTERAPDREQEGAGYGVGSVGGVDGPGHGSHSAWAMSNTAKERGPS